MREIKFRGKRTDTCEWVYGDLQHVQKICTTEETEKSGKRSMPVVRIANYDVDEETVGQFTGMKDKNVRKIYDGDILCYRDKKGKEYRFEVIFVDGAFCFSHFGNKTFTELREHDLNKYTVEGNIHDNPELLTD